MRHFTFIFIYDISQPGKHSSQIRQGNFILYPTLCYNRIIWVYKLRIFIVHFNGMFWVKFRMFLIFRVYGSFCANTLWIISIFRFHGDFGVSKFILRFYRSCVPSCTPYSSHVQNAVYNSENNFENTILESINSTHRSCEKWDKNQLPTVRMQWSPRQLWIETTLHKRTMVAQLYIKSTQTLFPPFLR